MKTKILVLTGTRAEYGLLYNLLRALDSHPDFELQLVVTGMHLSPEFGLTYRSIEADGFVIDAKVEMLLSSDTPCGVTKSMGLGLIGFAEAFERLKPDLFVVLGDRFEALAAAQAALVARVPIVHIHGGEITEGAIDDSIRHAITKMASVHFTSTEEFRRRVIQMGEDPSMAFNTGAIGVENILNHDLCDLPELESLLDFSVGSGYFLVVYHPVTLCLGDRSSISPVLDALEAFPDKKIVFVYPNADADGRALIEEIGAYAETRSHRVRVVKSLDSRTYLSALKHCDMLIGNSSSGLLEAPTLKKVAINVGDRQKGRLKAASVLDCREEAAAIVEAIERGASPAFQKAVEDVRNPYGDGQTVSKMIGILERLDVRDFARKKFFDRLEGAEEPA